MERVSGYADLNIPIGPKCQEVAEAAVKCGYRILAISTPVLARNIHGRHGNSKKPSKKRKWEERSGGILAATAAGTDEVPSRQSPQWIENLINSNPGLRILQRLTLIFSDVTELTNALGHPNAKEYDIFAVVPKNHEALQSCITSTSAFLVFDIISFDLEGPHWINKLRLNRQKGNLAAEKDIFFELTYASSLHGDEACENMMYAANCLKEDICVKKIKNMIITSGAATAVEVKAPKDVSTLGFLLGLDETTTRRCIREYAHRIVVKSDARKYGKTWAAFIPAQPEPAAAAFSVSNPSSRTSKTDEEDDKELISKSNRKTKGSKKAK